MWAEVRAANPRPLYPIDSPRLCVWACFVHLRQPPLVCVGLCLCLTPGPACVDTPRCLPCFAALLVCSTHTEGGDPGSLSCF